MAVSTMVRIGGLPAVVAAVLVLAPPAALAGRDVSGLVSGLGATCAEPPCPDLEIEIRQLDGNGAPVAGPVSAGGDIRLEVIAWNAGLMAANDVHVEVTLPEGVTWEIDAPGASSCSSSSGPGEPVTFSCNFGTLAPGTSDNAVVLLAVGTTALDDCGNLSVSAATHASNTGDERPSAGLTVEVECPPTTLVIDKAADAATVTITGPPEAPVASPSVVTWTLSYAVGGPGATNVTITDPLPAGLVFLDASDGGIPVDGAVRWTLPSVTTSGSVTLRTAVDPRTISRVAPTLNVVVVDSDETDPEEGADSISVTAEPPPLGGNPPGRPPTGALAPQGTAQSPAVPNTALPPSVPGSPIVIWLGLVAVASAGRLAIERLRGPHRSA